MVSMPRPELAPFTSSVRLWTWTLVAGLLIALWDASSLDMTVMRLLGSAHGFTWRHDFVLEHLLHDRARQLGILLYLLLLLLCLWPLGKWSHLTREQRFTMATGVTLALVAVNTIKRSSLTSCPWDLEEFGGMAHYVSHWNWGIADGGSGHCFPGGHASAAMAFLPLALPWWLSGNEQNRQRGRKLFLGILALGVILGTVQTLRGAHYPSHTLWTGLICWVVGFVSHELMARLPLRARSIGMNEKS